MSNQIILANNLSFDINEGGSLSNLSAIFSTEAKAKNFCDQLNNKENLTHIIFKVNDNIVGEYDNLILTFPPYRYDEIVPIDPESGEEPLTGRVIVSFGFREKTDIELRLDELEETQMIQDMAIDDLANVIAEE